MKKLTVRLQEYQKESIQFSSIRCAVSLHSHTHYSKDALNFVPLVASKIPILGQIFQRELQRYQEREGKNINFSQFHWNPPASPEMVWNSECSQIECLTQLMPLVSITDHNDIGAGLQLFESEGASHCPISVEWSVPYENAGFHLGVHNLPQATASEWMARMRDYQITRDREGLKELLTALSDLRQVLIVFNHPLWDHADLGSARHSEILQRFLRDYAGCIHALEFNGHRSHLENLDVIGLAQAWRLPVVAGGDRHGLSPNAVVTLTSAHCFNAFVEEIRGRQACQLLLLPQYFYPRAHRALRTATEALRHYRDYPAGKRYWTDRIHIRVGNEAYRPLSHHWGPSGPWWLEMAIWLTGVLGSPPARMAFQLATPFREGI